MTDTTITTPAVDVDTFDYKGTARTVAKNLYGAQDKFNACRRLHAASEAGASHEALAKEIAAELSELAAEKTTFSRQAVDQRVNAYALIVGLITPTADLVAKAYTLSQKPTAADDLIAVRKAFKSTGDTKADTATLLELIKAQIVLANAEKKRKAKAGKAGDEQTEAEKEEGKSTVDATFITAEELCALITAQSQRVWESTERELILDAMAVFAAATA